MYLMHRALYFFINDTATTEIYTLSLHDALPICKRRISGMALLILALLQRIFLMSSLMLLLVTTLEIDRKSGSEGMPRPISYAVFCLKKKTRRKSPPLPLACHHAAQTCELTSNQRPCAAPA